MLKLLALEKFIYFERELQEKYDSKFIFLKN